MDKQTIKSLIEEALELRSETSFIEFKDGRGGLPRHVWKAISAFSHQPGGGIIVFGVIEEKKNNQRSFRLNQRQIKIWVHLLENKKITAQDCKKILPNTTRVTLNRDLKKMRDLNLISKKGRSIETYYETSF
jgi:predicted HTH transcriptional regulator